MRLLQLISITTNGTNCRLAREKANRCQSCQLPCLVLSIVFKVTFTTQSAAIVSVFVVSQTNIDKQQVHQKRRQCVLKGFSSSSQKSMMESGIDDCWDVAETHRCRWLKKDRKSFGQSASLDEPHFFVLFVLLKTVQSAAHFDVHFTKHSFLHNKQPAMLCCGHRCRH